MSEGNTGNQNERPQQQKRAYVRERREPTELTNPVPLAFLIFSALIVIWGLSYFYTRIGAVTAAGDYRTPIVAEADSSGGAVDGSTVYANTCAACHQQSGAGIPGAFPPLDESEWVTGNPALAVQVVLHGLNGEIEVAGETFNGAMPAQNLSDEEIAAVVSYIRESWSNDADAITADFVAEQRAATEDQSGPWNGADELHEAVGEAQ